MKHLHIYMGEKPNLDDVTLQTIDQPIEGMWDVIECTALPSVERKNVISTVNTMTAHLVNRGELHLVTPSFEWACREALKNESNPIPQAIIFGTVVPYRSAYNLAHLRALLESAGLITRLSTQKGMRYSFGEEALLVPFNYVIGMKVE